MNQPTYGTGAILCLFATVTWGCMFPIMGDALQSMNAFMFTAIRYTLAALLFAAILLLREGRSALQVESRGLLVYLLGSMGFAGFGFFVFLGQHKAGESGTVVAAVIMALMPMLSVLISWMLRGQKPRLLTLLFVLMSFVGVLCVISKGEFSTFIAIGGDIFADLLILAGAVCWVVYTIGLTMMPGWSALRYTALTTAWSLPTIWCVNLVLILAGIYEIPSLECVAAVFPHLAYMVVITGFLGVLAWNAGNRIISPVNGVLFMDIVPVTTLLITALQGYDFAKAEIIGASITATALVLNNAYQRVASRLRQA